MDARNPYFYYSADLEAYIKEIDGDKEFLLLINKADYLSDELRQHWSTYFKENNINHIFFSALLEQDKIDKEDIKTEDEEDSIDRDEERRRQEEEFKEAVKLINTPKIFSRDDVMHVLRHKARA